MDTDDFSEMAYDIIVRAARTSDTLKAELGALSSRYKSENEWLRGVSKHLKKIISAPQEYVDYWNLEEEEGIMADRIKKASEDLLQRIDRVLMTSLSERGSSRW
ncbi:MAG: hypothetical protein P8Z37_11345 [Acidobacteriota bacterium]